MPPGMADGQRASSAASGEGSVPLSLSKAPPAPQHQRDKTEMQVALGDALHGARCPCPMSPVLSHLQPSSPKLSSKPSLSPKPCRARWVGLGELCWAQRDRMGQAEPHRAGTALPHPCSTITTAPIPLVPLKAD